MIYLWYVRFSTCLRCKLKAVILLYTHARPKKTGLHATCPTCWPLHARDEIILSPGIKLKSFPTLLPTVLVTDSSYRRHNPCLREDDRVLASQRKWHRKMTNSYFPGDGAGGSRPRVAQNVPKVSDRPPPQVVGCGVRKTKPKDR